MANAPGFDFPDGYTAFQFVFVILQASAFGGVFTGFAIARDFETGFGRRLLLAAPRRWAIIVGYALAALTRAVFVWIMLTVLAFAVGMHISGGVADVLALYLLAALLALAAVLWAAGIALRFRSLQAGPLMQTPGVHDHLPGARVRAHRAAARLGRGGGAREPDHADRGGRPRPDLGRLGEGLLAYGCGLGLCVLFGYWSLTGLRRAEAAGG